MYKYLKEWRISGHPLYMRKPGAASYMGKYRQIEAKSARQARSGLPAGHHELDGEPRRNGVSVPVGESVDSVRPDEFGDSRGADSREGERSMRNSTP